MKRLLAECIAVAAVCIAAAQGRAFIRLGRSTSGDALSHSRLLRLYCAQKPDHPRCDGVGGGGSASRSRSNGASSSARSTTSDRFVAAACARDSTLSICQRRGGGSSEESADTDRRGGSDRTAVERLPDDVCSVDFDAASRRCRRPETQADAVFCQQYARECDESLPKPDDGYCATYGSEYSSKCGGAVTRLDDQRFCKAYKVNCEDGPREEGDKPGVCDIYAGDFDQHCTTGERVDGELGHFCDRYYLTCIAPPEERAGAGGGNGAAGSSAERLVDVVDGDGKAAPPPAGEAIPQVTGPFVPNQKNLNASSAAQRQVCKRYEEQARLHCFGRDIEPEMIVPCHGYIRDCFDYYGDDEPLAKAASLFNSKVGWSTNNWGFCCIPFYPFNERGSIGGGERAGVDFGTWGGGYTERDGVGDFWQQGKEAGGNWYTGKYGAKDTWAVPFVPFVNGDKGTEVSVPINERTLGDPISVQTGNRVGPFWNNQKGPTVDWFNGGVQTGQRWQVPIAGVGFQKGSNVQFPSIGDFAPLIAAGR